MTTLRIVPTSPGRPRFTPFVVRQVVLISYLPTLRLVDPVLVDLGK